MVRQLGLAAMLLASLFARAEERVRREAPKGERNPLVIKSAPTMKLMKLEVQAPHQSISHILSGAFKVSDQYSYENTLQAISVEEPVVHLSPECILRL